MCQHVADAERPAEFAQDEGAAAAEILGHVDAAGDGEIGARARRPWMAPSSSVSPALTWNGLAVRRVELRAGERDGGVAGEAQRGAGDGDFEARGVFRIAHQAVGQAEGERIHGTGWRHADVPVAQAAGVILHGGLGARVEDFDGVAAVGEVAQEAKWRCHPASKAGCAQTWRR